MNYTLKEKDYRTLAAIDHIILQHKKMGWGPTTDTRISSEVFGENSVITKVRNAQRGFSHNKIIQLANFFNLDLNYFFREGVPLKYIPQLGYINSSVLEGVNACRSFHFSGGENYGNIYNGQIYIYLEKAKQMVENSAPRVPKSYKTILDTIQREGQELEKQLFEKTLELKEIEQKHSSAILKLKMELIEAKKSENEALKRLLGEPQIQNPPNSSIRQNGTQDVH